MVLISNGVVTTLQGTAVQLCSIQGFKQERLLLGKYETLKDVYDWTYLTNQDGI